MSNNSRPSLHDFDVVVVVIVVSEIFRYVLFIKQQKTPQPSVSRRPRSKLNWEMPKAFPNSTSGLSLCASLSTSHTCSQRFLSTVWATTYWNCLILMNFPPDVKEYICIFYLEFIARIWRKRPKRFHLALCHFYLISAKRANPVAKEHNQLDSLYACECVRVLVLCMGECLQTL